MKVYRYPLMKGMSHDTGPLPCPRCRSGNIRTESHPACGVMETCLECGARSNRQSWNDGHIDLQRMQGKETFEYIGATFSRPAGDEIVRTTRNEALRLTEGKTEGQS